MLPRKQRLTATQFDRAFAQSQQVRHPLVALRAHFRGDGDDSIRAAFVVPKKQAKKATDRNRIRRRLRERYRLHPARDPLALQGCDLIFMATAQTPDATGAQLDAALEEVLRRAGKKTQGGRQENHAQKEQGTPEVALSPVLSLQSEPVASSVADEGAARQRPLLTTIALGAIGFYQRFISPGLPPSCRFEPTCSRYTYASIERFGLLRGSALGVARVCRCNPWHAGGYDPVPGNFPHLFSRGQK